MADEVTKSDWVFLRDGLRSIENRTKGGEVLQGFAPEWTLPDDLTGQKAIDYVEAATVRLDEAESAWKRAIESPIEKVQEAGRNYGALLREVRKRELKILRSLGRATATAVEQSIARIEKTGENIATGLGAGAAFAIIVALLLLARGLGK